jgi:hypothetical protein
MDLCASPTKVRMHASEVTAHGWHGSGIGIGQSVVYSIALAAQMCSAAAVSSGRAICSSSSLPKPCLSLAFAHIETYAHQLARIANEGSTHEAASSGGVAVALANESRAPSPWPDMVGCDYVNGAAAGVTLGCAHSHIGTHWPGPTRDHKRAHTMHAASHKQHAAAWRSHCMCDQAACRWSPLLCWTLASIFTELHHAEPHAVEPVKGCYF